MFTLLVILAVIYVFLKVSNTRAEFARRDAEREAEAAAAAEAMEAEMEELAEEEEIRNSAIDVEADIIETPEPEDVAFSVEEPKPVEEEVF